MQDLSNHTSSVFNDLWQRAISEVILFEIGKFLGGHAPGNVESCCISAFLVIYLNPVTHLDIMFINRETIFCNVE